MNVIRTIQASERQSYVEKLFREGQQPADPDGAAAPLWPIFWPLPFVPREEVAGGFSYMVYRGHIIGFAKIARVEKIEASVPIGSGDQRVAARSRFVIEGAYTRTAPPLSVIPAPGFRNIRYTSVDLHLVDEATAARAVADALRSGDPSP